MIVTTIIPAYNSEKTLGRAIESVLSQKIPGCELIVIDDGSVDQTGRIARRYKKVRYLRQKNQGVSAARNRGIKLARGKYIALLDADDQWLPGKLRHQLDFLEKNPKVMVMSTGVNYLGQDNQKIRVSRLEKQGMIFKDLLEGNFIVISSAVIRRECMSSIARPFFPIGIFYGEDYAFWLKMAARYEFYSSPEVLTNYWLPSDQSFLRKFSFENMETAYGIMIRIAQDEGDRDGARILRAKLHWEISSIHARRGELGETFLETIKALRFRFWSRSGVLWGLENARILMKNIGAFFLPGSEKEDIFK